MAEKLDASAAHKMERRELIERFFAMVNCFGGKKEKERKNPAPLLAIRRGGKRKRQGSGRPWRRRFPRVGLPVVRKKKKKRKGRDEPQSAPVAWSRIIRADDEEEEGKLGGRRI